MGLVVYDWEVFRYDWMVVTVDLTTKEYLTIENDPELLMDFYLKHQYDIWVGFNSRHYDQYITKAALAGFDPKEINDHIIVKHKDGWTFSPVLLSIRISGIPPRCVTTIPTRSMRTATASSGCVRV